MHNRPCSSITVSVLIPNLHSPFIGDVVAALRHQSIAPTEVIVVGQDCYNLVCDDELIRVCQTPHPTPPALALNVALAYARGQVCCFLDADCVPHPDWLAWLLHAYQHGHPVVGGSLGFQPQRYWQRCDNIASWGILMETAPAGTRDHLSSGNMLVERKLLYAVGGHDEAFRRAGGEDTELCFRLRKQGVDLWFEPRAVVYNHTERDTARTVWWHLFRHGSQWGNVAAAHDDILPTSYWQGLAQRSYTAGMVLAGLAAARDTCVIFRDQPRLFWKQAHTVLGVFWARTGWYAGRLARLHGVLG